MIWLNTVCISFPQVPYFGQVKAMSQPRSCLRTLRNRGTAYLFPLVTSHSPVVVGLFAVCRQETGPAWNSFVSSSSAVLHLGGIVAGGGGGGKKKTPSLQAFIAERPWD
jgi:hypothetical protein